MSWFNCKVSFERSIENGISIKTQMVEERYLVQADSFEGAETLVAKKLNKARYVVRSLKVVRPYCVYEDLKIAWECYFYNCEIEFWEDENDRSRMPLIVQADSIEGAISAVRNALDDFPPHFRIVSVSQTDYLRVIR